MIKIISLLKRDSDARQAAFAGPEGKAAVADVSAHCASRTLLVVEEFKPLSP
jgi:hypothetical protein